VFGLAFEELAIVAVVLIGAVFFLGVGRTIGWFIVLLGGLVAAYCLLVQLLFGPAVELVGGIVVGLAVLWLGTGVVKAAREE
jgi:hypothetical protein